jgi:tRNA U34 5-methylaminomethyl-2-thiouridine-forming methyltransferase MnmC
MTKLVLTGDGSHTFYNEALDEHYHSVNGARLESETVFINNGLKYSELKKVRIFEVGFGTGLNAFLTLTEAEKSNLNVYYSTCENYPLEMGTVMLLNYTDGLNPELKNQFLKLHSSPWGEDCKISVHFTLNKIKADLTLWRPSGSFDIVFFDAFAPTKQPQMWSKEIIEACCNLLSKGGIFTTYSVRGELKRMLKDNGFEITLLPGPPGKREVLRGVKK